MEATPTTLLAHGPPWGKVVPWLGPTVDATYGWACSPALRDNIRLLYAEMQDDGDVMHTVSRELGLNLSIQMHSIMLCFAYEMYPLPKNIRLSIESLIFSR